MCPALDVALPTTIADPEHRPIPTVAGAVPSLAADANFSTFFLVFYNFTSLFSLLFSLIYICVCVGFRWVLCITIIIRNEASDLNKDYCTSYYTNDLLLWLCLYFYY